MENEKLRVLRQVVEQGFGNADLYVIDQLMKEDFSENQFGMRGGREGSGSPIRIGQSLRQWRHRMGSL